MERLENGKKAPKPEFTSDSIAYDKRMLTVWLDERKCSFSTVDRRIKTDFAMPKELNDYYEKYLEDGWQICQSTIEKHEYEDEEPYYLHLGLEKETPENNSPNPTVMGVDLGVENLAVTPQESSSLEQGFSISENGLRRYGESYRPRALAPLT